MESWDLGAAGNMRGVLEGTGRVLGKGGEALCSFWMPGVIPAKEQ